MSKLIELQGQIEKLQKQADDMKSREFDKTIESDVDYCYAYYHKARALEQAGKIGDAAATLRTGLERARASGDTHAISEIQSLLDQIS